MSYILEALKKAQAERQLGSAPTIHAMPIQAAPPERGGAGRTPLAIALTAAIVAAIAGGVVWWRQALPVAPAAPVVVAPVAVVTPAPAPVPVPVPMPMPVPVPVPVPVQAAPPPKPAPVKPRAPEPAPVAEQAVGPAPEETLPLLRDLPESQRSGLPQVTFGGYMYSPNPADRLLLIDKTLRHEGEEVAPGLVLEKLLPKSAVMNYRGTRYRVAF